VVVAGNHDEDKVSKKTGEPRTTMQWQKDMRFLTWPYQLWWLAPLWPALGGHWMRPDWQHKLKLIQPLTRLRRAAAALHRYLHRHWYSFFGPLLLAHSDMTPYHRFTQKRLLDVEEFHDKQTLGGDHEGDVWLYDMNEKEFEMLKQWSELQRAVYFGQTWLVEQLLRDGKASFVEAADSINADSGSIVIPSGGGEDKGMVRYQGNCVDIQAKDHLGCSPLHLAVKAGHLDMVEVLLKYGARTDAADDLGWTPLMLAAHTGFIDALEAMLRTDDAAPDVGNALDKQQTALMLAAAEGHLNAVKVLAVAGSDLDATDSDGRTALNYAVSHAHHHVMQWLKNRGATLRVVLLLPVWWWWRRWWWWWWWRCGREGYWWGGWLLLVGGLVACAPCYLFAAPLSFAVPCPPAPPSHLHPLPIDMRHPPRDNRDGS
jgi:hypothetical protein